MYIEFKIYINFIYHTYYTHQKVKAMWHLSYKKILYIVKKKFIMAIQILKMLNFYSLYMIDIFIFYGSMVSAFPK